MSRAMMKQIRVPLFLSFFLLIFLAIPKYGNAFQLVSLALIVTQNIFTFISLRKSKFNTFGKNRTLLSILLIALIPLQSLINNFFNFEPYYVEYSVLFLVAAFSIYTVVNTVEFHIIFNSFRYAAIAITLTILLTSSGLLSQTLSITYDPVNGLDRFSPYGLHPNLVGHIFGGFAVMFFCSMLSGKNMTRKIFFAALMGVSMLYCVAASSRGGFFAAVLGIGAVCATVIWQDRVKRKYFMLFILLAILAFFATGAGVKMVSYLSSIFEFASNDRGMESGLTGRTANWGKLLHTVFSSVTFMLFGSGLRTGGVEVLGYDIDNSYLNLLYEIGLPSTAIFIMLLLATTNKLRKALLKTPDLLKAIALGLLVFTLCESVVARYLLSIGNPLSLFVLYCMLGAKNILKSPPGAVMVRPHAFHEMSLQHPYMASPEGARLS